jgi:hypothetical protein
MSLAFTGSLRGWDEIEFGSMGIVSGNAYYEVAEIGKEIKPSRLYK